MQKQEILSHIRRKEVLRPQDHLTVHESGDLVWLTSPLLEQIPGIRHGFSTRLGGVSAGDAGTLNLGFAREENAENVRENYRRIMEALEMNPERLVMTKQTHTTNVKIAVAADAGAGYAKERDYDNIDALVTNKADLPLVCFSADCVPLLIADPVHGAIGCAHSGWRGTVHDIGGEVLRVMAQEYGTHPEDVFAAIGPSICQDCYEVSEDVTERFAARYPQNLHEKLFYRKENGKYQLDLWEACRQNFLGAGVLPEQISLPDLCTRCNPDLLFSHRVLHGRQGNLGAFICLMI